MQYEEIMQIINQVITNHQNISYKDVQKKVEGGWEQGLLEFSYVWLKQQEERNERKILLMSLFSNMLCDCVKD